jgi:hypothetical protein
MFGVPELLSLNDLKFGDVLFCGSSINEKNTNLIQNTTDGSYVHCAIYIGDNKIVDVTTSGIRKRYINTFINDYSYVAITRCPGDNLSRKKAIEIFIDNAFKKQVKYNWFGALFSPIKEYINITWFYSKGTREEYHGPTLAKEKYFCSEFVVDCYKASGYIRTAKRYMISNKWTPTGLAEENIFGFIGYISNNGLKAVDHNDPFLGGNIHLLTEKGREGHLKHLATLKGELINSMSTSKFS